MKLAAKVGLLVAVIGLGIYQYVLLYDCWRLGGEYDFLRCHCSISLLYSAKDGDLKGMQEELDRGTPIDVIDSQNFTALAWATRMGKDEAAAFLLNKGANPSSIDALGGTPLIYAVTSCTSLDLLKQFANRGTNLEVKDPDGTTALSMAARVANADAVAVLLSSGANAKVRDKSGRTPLQVAQMKLKELGNTDIYPDPRQRYSRIIKMLSKAESRR